MDTPALLSKISEIVNKLEQKHVLPILAGLSIISLVRYIRSPYRRLPPGPRGLPLLGNLFQLLGKPQWLTFTGWCYEYGNLVHVNVAGQRIIVMNSSKVTTDLLERRAAIYSDRPRNIVAAELLTGGLFLVFIGYTDLWRRMRKGAHEALHKGIADRYNPTQMLEAIIFTTGVLNQPDKWISHARRSAASTVMSVIYDSPTLSSDGDPSVKAINDFVARLTHAALPGAHLVEFFTWMKYIPASLAKWKRESQEWFKRDTKTFESLFLAVRDRILEGDDRPSIAATLIEHSQRLKLSQDENTWLAATIYAAGAETTAGVMTWWMHAMVLNPEVQLKAQEELDRVVGRDRLPTFADRGNLPYIQAMVKETLRLRPVDPLGMPHYTTEDDWYEGMFIPKGTVCIANVWHLNRDPAIYGPDANKFNPERYLRHGGIPGESADAQEEGHFTYGFGRRICVGRHVANNSLFIDMAVMLWAMRVECATDVDVDGCVDHGLVVGPVPFKIKTSARFPEAMSILEEERERWSTL